MAARLHGVRLVRSVGMVRYRRRHGRAVRRSAWVVQVAFLLVEGELPTPAQLSAFEHELRAHSLIHTKLLA